MLNYIDYNSIYGNKFRPAYKELQKLQNKIYAQDGFWIFRSHIFSKEALMQSPHLDRVNSITWKIGSDVRIGIQNGGLSPIAQSIYENYRGELNSKIDQVYRAVESRQPTWWEEAKGTIWGVLNSIMYNLPKIVVKLVTQRLNPKLFPLFSLRKKKQIGLDRRWLK